MREKESPSVGRGLLLPAQHLPLAGEGFGEGSGGLPPPICGRGKALPLPHIGPPVIALEIAFMKSRLQRRLIHSSSD